MKKVTLLFMLLCSLITYSQVYLSDNFDSYSNNSGPSWSGPWTTHSAYLAGNCDGKSLFAFDFEGSGIKTFTTPSQTSNGTDLNIDFDFRIADTEDAENPLAPPAGWGNVVFEYTINGTDWTVLETIDDSNYIYDGTCQAMSYTINASNLPDGDSFQFRTTYTITADSGATYLFCSIDNLTIAQQSTTPPNCDAALTSATTGVPVDMPTISWSSATGIPTGYKLAVGTTEEDYTFFASTDVGNVTSYQLPNLQYSTTYYVKIIPYNANGDADCTGIFGNFITEDAPPAGDVCSSAFDVDLTSGSFSDSIDLGDFADDYSGTGCPYDWNYISGNEMLYSITPDNDMSINVNVTNIQTRQTTMHIIDGCPDAGTTNCIEVITSDDVETANVYPDINADNIVLLAGNTYYIVMASNNTTTSNSTFDIDITTNECIIPAATFTAVGDCETEEFNVTVDLTYFGNPFTPLILSDGINPDIELVALGEQVVGPYPSGTNVTFTITNNDYDCSISESVAYYCPPSNDECENAISLTASTDNTCDNAVEGSTLGASHSTANTCNADLKDVWYSFTPAETGVYTFNVTNLTGTGMSRISAFSGTCESLSLVSTCDHVTSMTLSLSEGTTYFIPVQTEGTAENTTQGKTFEICVYQVPVVANNDCSNAEIVPESDMSGSNTVTGTLENAYFSPGICTTDPSYESVWYSFTPQYTGTYHVDFTALTGDPDYTIYDTSDCALTGPDAYVTGISSCYNSGEFISDITVTAGTTYLMTVHASALATFEFFIYPDATLSNTEVNFEGFRYYPNPVKNTLTFESPNMISSVAIYNVVGQKVLATAGNNTMSTVNMSALPNGIYFAKVTIDGAEKTIKIIKE